MKRGSPVTEEDLLTLIEQAADDDLAVSSSLDAWKVLIVDDDDEVHRATEFALGARKIFGRAIELFHAHSSAAAVEVLKSNRDMAVALVDVVMERERAGLELVGVIREKLRLVDLRIILRTGQPGFAPELDAVTQYDINDYHAKLEMTEGRLVASLTTALRTYEQLSLVSANRRALEALTRLAPRALVCESAIDLFEATVAAVMQIVPTAEHVAIVQRPFDEGTLDAWKITTGTGRFRSRAGESLCLALDEHGAESLVYVLATGKAHGSMMRRVLPITDPAQGGPLLWVESSQPLRTHEASVLDVLCVTAMAALTSIDARERLARLALVDGPTGLPSRPAFEQHLKERADSIGDLEGVVLVDLDRLDDIRDTMGAQIGDDLIGAAAERLRESLSSCELVARTSNTTIGAFTRRLETTQAELLVAFEEPLAVSGFAVRVPAVVGIATSRVARSGGIDLLSAASLALSAARRAESNRARVFERALLDETRSRLARLESLRHAVARQELELHYQPQVEIATGRLVGAEALIRWRRSSGELVPPLAFIELAEQSGLIAPIGEWVLRETCRQLRAWDQSGVPPMRVGVNVSVAQFHHADFAASVERALADFGTDPSRLELELTESVGLEDLMRAREIMTQIRALGVTWALDDFGVGYSSLGYLRSLPISRLKIDRLFTAAIRSRTDGVAIPRMIIELTRDLGLDVIAEGVETAEVAQTLLEFGCHVGQGYFYAKPLAPADFRAYALRPVAAHVHA